MIRAIEDNKMPKEIVAESGLCPDCIHSPYFVGEFVEYMRAYDEAKHKGICLYVLSLKP